jgi:Cft2 family RNA processing exonuclease
MQQDVAYNLHEAIRRRAEEIYERNGKIPGRDVKNRMRAEEEIKSEAAGDAERRTAVIVKVNGIDQAGEYAQSGPGLCTGGVLSRRRGRCALRRTRCG